MGVKHQTPIRFDDVPGQLPKVSISDNVNLESLATKTVARLGNLKEDDFVPEALWRDFWSMTDHLRTFHSSKTIFAAFTELSTTKIPSGYQLTTDAPRIARFGSDSAWVDIEFTFRTDGGLKANNEGIVSVIPDESDPSGWKIFMLRTWIENFEGHGHPDKLEPTHENIPNSSTNGVNGHATPRSHADGAQYGAVVVGGGQSGLSCAGRLEALGVPYLLIEKNSEIGENWTKRYESLRWHTSKEYGNLPFDRTYLPEDDYMLTTKMIGSGFKRWSERFGINAWVGTSVQQASWNDETRIWTVQAQGSGGTRTVTASYLILAVGAYAGTPISPDWPGRQKFRGTAMHSIDYKSSKPWSGKKGIVVGTANTGHDVAEDMVLAGCSSVTMVQRGHTLVFPVEWLHTAEDISYNLDIPTHKADRMTSTYPNKITREFTNKMVFQLTESAPERFDALERVGFKLERKGDIYDNLYCRFGGHYVDIGTSDRISKGQIKMKSNSAVQEWTENGLRFEDGSEIEADLVVLCTGFDHDFRKTASDIVGKEVADAMDDFYGIDSEGEIRGASRLAGHPALYYHGGDVRMCRWFSRFIALQIQANVLVHRATPYLKTPD